AELPSVRRCTRLRSEGFGKLSNSACRLPHIRVLRRQSRHTGHASRQTKRKSVSSEMRPNPMRYLLPPTSKITLLPATMSAELKVFFSSLKLLQLAFDAVAYHSVIAASAV